MTCCICESYDQLLRLRSPARHPRFEEQLQAHALVCSDCYRDLLPISGTRNRVPQRARRAAPAPRRTPRAHSLDELRAQGLVWSGAA